MGVNTIFLWNFQIYSLLLLWYFYFRGVSRSRESCLFLVRTTFYPYVFYVLFKNKYLDSRAYCKMLKNYRKIKTLFPALDAPAIRWIQIEFDDFVLSMKRTTARRVISTVQKSADGKRTIRPCYVFRNEIKNLIKKLFFFFLFFPGRSD